MSKARKIIIWAICLLIGIQAIMMLFHEIRRHSSGAWPGLSHWLYRKVTNFYYDDRFANNLADNFYGVNSVLDFGCGLGTYLSVLHKKNGVQRAVCIEPFDMSWYREDGISHQISFDFGGKHIPPTKDYSIYDKELATPYDMVMTIEVIEHIPHEFRNCAHSHSCRFHEQIFDLMTNMTRCWIVFSAAQPEQLGTGHIAPRILADWADEFTNRGFVYVADKRNAIIDSNNIMQYLRANVMIFKKEVCPQELEFIPKPRPTN